jgi:beta-glucosidase
VLFAIAYASGEHAPGLRDPRAALAAVHHQHLAHGLALEALRDGPAHSLGITLNLTNANPNVPDDPTDIEAARRIDALVNRMYLEPVLLGRYPEDLLDDVREYGLEEVVRDGDMKLAGAPMDFLGVNYYHDDNVSGHPLPAGARQSLTPTARPKSSPFVGSEYVTFPSRDLPRTDMDWEVNPDGLRKLLVRLSRTYANLPPPT